MKSQFQSSYQLIIFPKLKIITSVVLLYWSCSVVTANEIGWQATGNGGAVAAGHSDSVAAGISALEKGGNAADAAATTILALAVTDYGLFAIGGEVPILGGRIGEESGKRGRIKGTQLNSLLSCVPLNSGAISA